MYDYYQQQAMKLWPTPKVGDRFRITITKTGLSWLWAKLRGKPVTEEREFEITTTVTSDGAGK